MPFWAERAPGPTSAKPQQPQCKGATPTKHPLPNPKFLPTNDVDMLSSFAPIGSSVPLHIQPCSTCSCKKHLQKAPAFCCSTGPTATFVVYMWLKGQAVPFWSREVLSVCGVCPPCPQPPFLPHMKGGGSSNWTSI